MTRAAKDPEQQRQQAEREALDKKQQVLAQNNEGSRYQEIKFERALKKEIPGNYERQELHGLEGKNGEVVEVRPDFVIHDKNGRAQALVELKAGEGVDLKKERGNIQLAYEMTDRKAIVYVFEKKAPPNIRKGLERMGKERGVQVHILEDMSSEAAVRWIRSVYVERGGRALWRAGATRTAPVGPSAPDRVGRGR